MRFPARLLPALAAVAAAVLNAACSVLPSAGPMKVDNGRLVDLNGMSLYVYDRDTVPLESTCYLSCLPYWPPLDADVDAPATGEWLAIKRDDGVWQWTYKGRPVYRSVRDRKSGDTLGDGADGIWHLLRP